MDPRRGSQLGKHRCHQRRNFRVQTGRRQCLLRNQALSWWLKGLSWWLKAPARPMNIRKVVRLCRVQRLNVFEYIIES